MSKEYPPIIEKIKNTSYYEDPFRKIRGYNDPLFLTELEDLVYVYEELNPDSEVLNQILKTRSDFSKSQKKVDIEVFPSDFIFSFNCGKNELLLAFPETHCFSNWEGAVKCEGNYVDTSPAIYIKEGSQFSEEYLKNLIIDIIKSFNKHISKNKIA